MDREHIAVALAILVLIGLILFAIRPVKEGYYSRDALFNRIFASEYGEQVLQFTGSSTSVNHNGVQTNIRSYNSSTDNLTLGDGTTFKQYQINSVPYLVHLSSNTRMNVFTISNLTISNEPNGIGVRLGSVSHLSITFNVKVTPGTNRNFTGNQLLSSTQVVPITKTQGTTYTVTLTLANQPTLTLLTGTIVPIPRPSPTPPPRPSPTPPQSTWTRYTSNTIVKYDIKSDITLKPGESVQSIAESTPGCNAYVFDNSTNKYSLKCINFKTMSDIPINKAGSNLTVYAKRPIDVPNRSYRIDNDHHEADPCTCYYNGYVYYVYTGSFGTKDDNVTFKRVRSETLYENMFNDKNSPYINTGFNRSNILTNANLKSFTSFWSPAIKFVNNVCYYTFSISENLTNNDDSNSRIYHIYCRDTSNPDATQWRWEWGGRITNDAWSIDSELFEIGGNLYMASSRGRGPSNQYISVFKINIDPVSRKLSIDSTIPELAIPKQTFEFGDSVNEGPSYFYDTQRSKHMIFFSASFFNDPTYCVGAFQYNGPDTNPLNILNKNNWSSVSTKPLLKSDPATFPNTSTIKNLRGTGHNAFVVTPTKKYIVYHATISDSSQSDYIAPDGQKSYRIVFFHEFTDVLNLGGALHGENINLGGESGGYFF